MSSFDAYMMYLAVKRHFSSSYDYKKYNGKLNVTRASLDKRRDKYSFEKLAKKSDPLGLCVANLFADPSMWVGDLFSDDAEAKYTDMRRRRETLTYLFKNELADLDLTGSMQVVNGDHPELLKLYLRGRVSPETMIILDDAGKVFDHWSKNIQDEYRWPDERFKLDKLRSFLSYDKPRYRNIIRSLITNS